MEKRVTTLMLAFACKCALAGTCTYSFGWFKNAAVTDFNVPLVLQEGRNGFTYAGFADAEGGTDLRVADTDSTLLPYEIENWNPAEKIDQAYLILSLKKGTLMTDIMRICDSLKQHFSNSDSENHFGTYYLENEEKLPSKMIYVSQLKLS